MQQILSLCALLLLCALTQNTAFAQEIKPMVGNDKDAHGCKPSAGYTWSVIKEECIRVFEDGHRLDAKAKGLDKTFSAFVVFRSTMNQAQAELYLPSSKESVLLSKKKGSDADFWENKAYTLKKVKGKYSLYSKKKLLYQTEK